MSRYLTAPAGAPASLYRTGERDLTMRLLEKFVDRYLGTSLMVNRRDIEQVIPKTMRPDEITVVVRERRVEAHDENVVSLVFEAPDGRRLPRWNAGAHLDLRLPSGRQRQYSLCGDPADRRRYRIAVRRIPGGAGSVEIHDELTVGTELVVSKPRNAFGFSAPGYGSSAKHLHFIAAGIGITPILPMVRIADRLGLDWTMTYTGRSRDSLPFLDEIEAFGDRVTVRTDDIDGLPEAKDLLADVLPDTAIYTCGPVPMVTGLLDELRHVPDVEFHYERFSAPPVVDGRAFEVELIRTGEKLEVPADRSLLDVVREARPDIAYSCQQGFCRTCVVRVVEGEPDHREKALSDDERACGDMLICVSRATGGCLKLDL
jgi:ferredoxin-NADP reductase